MARTKKHPGTIEKRGSSFRIILYADGTRHTYTLADVTKIQAENFARDQHKKLTRRAARNLPGIVRFSELLTKFEEQELPNLSQGGRESYADSFRPFRSFFVDQMGDPIIDEVRAGHVKEFLGWRRVNRGDKRGKTVSNHTIARDRRVLHRLFEYACELEYVEANPVARVAAPKGDPHTPNLLTPGELEQLLEACADRDMLRLYVLVLAETGARADSEALHLQWSDVDAAGGFIQIRSGRDGHRTKSGKSRWVPMSARLADALQEHAARYRLAMYQGDRTPWLFHHTRTLRQAKAGERIRSLRDPFNAAVERAKLPALRQHDLRHRRVTTWLAEGKDVVHVKEAVGHADLATTMGYTHLAREHLRSLVNAPATAQPIAAPNPATMLRVVEGA